MVGYPVMVAEITIGRRAKKNPVGAFRALSPNRLAPLIGFWGLMCGVMILAFYNVVAGWTAGFVFEEVFHWLNLTDLAASMADTESGHKNAVLSMLFMIITLTIVAGGVSSGIERATKAMMPMLVILLLMMIGYVVLQDGAVEGLVRYLKPDFSRINTDLVLSAMGQAFFSLSLGMGALITYGSYLTDDQNIPESAAYVTLADMAIAFLAGFLIMPAMFVAQKQGITILDEQGVLVSSETLVFNVLPNLFHNLGGLLGVLFGVLFFLLLSIAALTSTISLLEVPVAYLIDEHGFSRRKAALGMGSFVTIFSLLICYDTSWIGALAGVFNNIGLPLGGLLICLFLAYVWKTGNAVAEMEKGYPGVGNSLFGKVWAIFVKFICPVLIGIVFITSAYPVIRPLFSD
jgi:NSS family neurotransmitter:Na+ symporter